MQPESRIVPYADFLPKVSSSSKHISSSSIRVRVHSTSYLIRTRQINFAGQFHYQNKDVLKIIGGLSQNLNKGPEQFKKFTQATFPCKISKVQFCRENKEFKGPLKIGGPKQMFLLPVG